MPTPCPAIRGMFFGLKKKNFGTRPVAVLTRRDRQIKALQRVTPITTAVIRLRYIRKKRIVNDIRRYIIIPSKRVPIIINYIIFVV